MIFGAAYILLWLLVAVEWLVILVLVRQLADLRLLAEMGMPTATHRLSLGGMAPEFTAMDLRSNRSIQSLALHGARTVLFFLSTDCSLCRKLVAELGDVPAENLTGLVIYCHGADRGCRNYLSPLADKVRILLKDQVDVPAAYRLSGFPVAVIVDERWRVAGFRYPSNVGHIVECLSAPGSTSTTALQPT